MLWGELSRSGFRLKAAAVEVGLADFLLILVGSGHRPTHNKHQKHKSCDSHNKPPFKLDTYI